MDNFHEALIQASFDGNIDFISQLEPQIRTDISKYFGKNRDGWTPIHATIFHGHDSCLRKLLEILTIEELQKHLNVYMGTTDFKRNPLDRASASGSIECIKTLIDYGVDINKKNNYGWSPLHQASDNDDYDAIKVLLNLGADPNATNEGRHFI
jgi:ankyrin repeat protein